MTALAHANDTAYDQPKLCECGCGEPAPLSKRTHAGRGHFKDQPRRFITNHDKGTVLARRKLEDGEWLRRIYVEGGRTQKEIAAILGCHQSTVGAALRRHSIETTVQGRRAVLKLRDVDWLRRCYVDDRMSLRDIAGKAGCTADAVAKALSRHNIETRSPIQAALNRKRFTRMGKVEALRRAKAKDAGDVGKAYTTVIRELGKLGRAPRTTREQNKLVDTAMHHMHEAEQALGLWLDLN